MSPVPRRYDAVLLDMGYTLVYFEPRQPAVVQAALRAAGAERSEAEILAATDVVWGEYYRDADRVTFPATEAYDREVQWALSRDLLAQMGVTGDGRVAAYHAALEERFSRPGAMRLYPEVPAVLARLREEGYRLGIVSNWSWNLRQRVDQVGLGGYFELIWASAYAGCNKPHPAIFQQALARLDVAAGRALYAGDSYEHDVGGGRNAGLDVVLIDRARPPASRDCPVITDLAGLFSFLDTAGD